MYLHVSIGTGTDGTYAKSTTNISTPSLPSLPSLTLCPNIGGNVWKMALVGHERRWFDQHFDVAGDSFGEIVAGGEGAGTAFFGKRVAGDRNAVQTTGVFGRRVFQGLQWNVGRD